jgi:hypothetical protein
MHREVKYRTDPRHVSKFLCFVVLCPFPLRTAQLEANRGLEFPNLLNSYIHLVWFFSMCWMAALARDGLVSGIDNCL